jgi:glycosyltransferase involved in cell wall biosynthesis
VEHRGRGEGGLKVGPTLRKSSMWPRITVVTPSYNQGKFIEATIRSVLDQGYPNLEYIVMDGGSSDDSVEIIRRYEKHLAYWTSEKDEGASDAIRKGFARATGTILAYLNSDDLYLPVSLEAIAETMMAPDVDVAYGNMYWIDTTGNTIGEQRQTPFMPLAYLYGGSTLQQPATFWKKDVYIKCGEMDPSYRFAFDMDLFVRFARAGARFKHVNRFVASFRIHPQSKSSNEFDLCARELQRLRQAYLPFPFQSFRGRCVRGMATLHRTFWYAVQGDLLWLLGRIPDRLRARHAQAMVGPRGRRM